MSALQAAIQLAASKHGARLFRNQTGTYRVGERWISSGLVVGGSDLIGWTPVTVQDRQLAIFTAIEIKAGRDRLTSEQKSFLDAVRRAGGLGIEARSVDAVERALADLAASV